MNMKNISVLGRGYVSNVEKSSTNELTIYPHDISLEMYVIGK